MDGFIEKNQAMEGKKEEGNGGKIDTCADFVEEKGRQSSSSSEFLLSETTGLEEQNQSSSEEESPSPPSTMGWPVKEIDNGEKKNLDNKKREKQVSLLSEIEMMKERFAKLLLGEDMSGCGNGVPTALAISNAITNLCATLFGQVWRLEPLPPEKKAMWRREIEWLLCVSDHIVELTPTWQTFPDGSKLELHTYICQTYGIQIRHFGIGISIKPSPKEVMTCRPRSDLYVNLPALRKLDNMLLEVLDGFVDTEFWYVDQGVLAPDADDGSSSFRRAVQRQEEKWWLPVPRVPPCGLHENSRKQLQHKRDCTNQILKAAMAINSITLAEMEIPEAYLESLPKNARASLGDLIHRYISSEQFSPECLLACLDLSSEHQAIEITNRVEASIYIWHKKTNSKPASRSSSRSSWGMMKDLVGDAEKRELLADRAESLLLSLKQRFPGLPQTTLDMSKIQYNKDVGKSILESYSRVLESLAFNIIARIDDVFYVDELTKHSDHFSSLSKVGVVAHKSITVPYNVPVPSSPYKTAFATPSFSPAHGISPVKGEKSQFMNGSRNLPHRGGGVGVKKVLTDFLSIDTKGKGYSSSNNPIKKLVQTSERSEGKAAFETDLESSECREEEATSPEKIKDQAWAE